MLDDSPATGEQTPQILHRPSDVVASSGAEAVEICQIANVLFDPWQKFALDVMLSERADGSWAAFEVGLLLARQNGKGEVLLGRELFGLFVAHESLIIHSAHEFKTADEAFARVRDTIRNCEELSRKVRSMPESHGEEGVILRPLPTVIYGAASSQIRRSRTPRLRFVARTGSAARGFSADTVLWDEAFNLPQTVVNAQMPILSAMPNPQLIYASSAVDQTLHAYGVHLARVRARGLAGLEADLAWLEWQGDETRYRAIAAQRNSRLMKMFLADQAQWRAANPGIGYRLSVAHTAKEHRSMSSRTFAVERLNIGDWPAIDEEITVVDMSRWDEIGDPDSRPGKVIALSIDVSPDAKWAAIGSAGYRSDERLHVKVVDHRPGTHWVVERIVDLIGAYKVCAVVLDPAGPAGALIPDLKKAGVKVKQKLGSGHLVTVSAREMAQACGALINDIEPERDHLRHCGQDNLTDALRDADTRPLSDAWAWSRKNSGGDITPVVVVTLAAHGMRVHGKNLGIVPWAARS